ncbi:polysaccharide biosynthesis tyrosine autokinase [Paractinoplanes durhamensis]|uniref:Sugar tyrosine-protein kinase n=1 Tax=Paractinoplanes durhamensis TaxID=113563 RepID=A0ABQ3Z540_9ACTN|nr:polysaccharide biosynthesis tyrosine autokinase [Actinoplanes durhamensis]GIE04952.1 sugar tyrosine-protein kinase [Actinoplanes durhamensis]
MNTFGGPARLIRAYGWWIALVTLVVMAAGYGVSTLAPTVYRSAAIVVVEARVRANTTPVPPEMGTEKELAKSGLVVRPAAASMGLEEGQLADGFTVSVAPDANVLTFIYESGNPVTAQRRAQALAEAYVTFRNAGEQSKSATAAATANAHATLVSSAYLPSVPEARPVWIDLAIGLVLGLLLGIGTALIRDRMSDRIRSLRDFEKLSGVPVLATVPRTARPRGPGAALPVLLRSPQSPAAESYRYLRSRLQPVMAKDGATSVLVASAYDGEGRSTTAANLAAALALAGRTVILVDADLPKPQQHTMFDLSGERGLTDLLAATGDDIRLPDVLQQGPVARLRLLAAGPGADRAHDLLEGPRLGQVLSVLGRLADVIVIDSPAILSVSDAIGLAAVADHVLLVGDYRRSTRAGVGRALAELAEVVDGNVSSVLVNAPKSAGGLVPRPRGAVAAHIPVAPAADPSVEEHGLALLDATSDRSGSPVVGSASVPKSMVPTSPATPSTVYQSASSPPVISPPSGPVKTRTNGSSVPAPREDAS